jgi:hypothetical protein
MRVALARCQIKRQATVLLVAELNLLRARAPCNHRSVFPSAFSGCRPIFPVVGEIPYHRISRRFLSSSASLPPSAVLDEALQSAKESKLAFDKAKANYAVGGSNENALLREIEAKAQVAWRDDELKVAQAELKVSQAKLEMAQAKLEIAKEKHPKDLEDERAAVNAATKAVDAATKAVDDASIARNAAIKAHEAASARLTLSKQQFVNPVILANRSPLAK